jgi:hypothetical protein
VLGCILGKDIGMAKVVGKMTGDIMRVAMGTIMITDTLHGKHR